MQLNELLFLATDVFRTAERIMLHVFIATTGPEKKVKPAFCLLQFTTMCGFKTCGFSIYDPYR